MRTLTRPAQKTRSIEIPAGFAWLKEFNSKEQAEFVSGLLARILTATKSGDWSPVSEWVEEWKATANIYADPVVSYGIEEGLKQIANGDFVDWETLRAELRL